MYKKFSRSDITVRPFRAYKNWTIQSIDSSSVDEYGDSTYYSDKIVVNEGIKNETIFYPSGSAFYDPIAEPINPSGEYKRNTYSSVDSLFYRNLDNPLNQFGLECVGEDPITKKKEIREIGDRVVVGRIRHNFWGEKVNPNTVRITDYSSPHGKVVIADDGFTNLYASGSYFPNTTVVNPYNSESSSYWVSGSGAFYYKGVQVTYEKAQSIKDAGGLVDYIASADSWGWTISSSIYHPDTERFGQSVSAWYKYAFIGSPTDENTSAYVKNGRADIYKYDPIQSRHRLVKTFRSPFIEKREDLTSSYQDSFGYSVCVRDDFAVVGAPTEDGCLPLQEGAGTVYVYDKYKGGADFWGIINILEGASPSDRFGASVSHEGGVLAVGAPGANNNSGSVYVFRKKQYVTGKDAVCNGVVTSSFWQKVSAEEDCTILVTETGTMELYAEEGTPYFISGNFTWELETVFTSNVANAQFGYSVSVSGEKIAVGTNILNGLGYAQLFTASFSSVTASYYNVITDSGSNGNTASFDSVPTCESASWGVYKEFHGTDSYADLDRNDPFNLFEVDVGIDGFGTSVCVDGEHLAICSPSDKWFTPYISSPITKSLGAVYFYSFGVNEDCNVYDFEVRSKTFGDRSFAENNNFAKSVAISSGRAAVGYSADKTVYLAQSESGSVVIEGWQNYSTSSSDQSQILGRVSVYSFDIDALKWNLVSTLNRSKEAETANYNFGWSTAITDMTSDYMYLVVGAPAFSYPETNTELDYIVSASASDPTFMSASLHGSAYIYDLNKFEKNQHVGNVFYKNGQLVITSENAAFRHVMTGTGSRGFVLDYKGTHTIYEHEYLISLTPSQFNYSTNPSSLQQYPLAFDVNQDGTVDMTDIDLILRFLNSQRFYTVNDTDDNGLVLEQDTLQDESWWNNDILQTESEDVLYLEAVAPAAGTSVTLFDGFLNEEIYNYIRANLVDTGLLDIDRNGTTDIRDGAILLNYFLGTLNEVNLATFVDEDSQRRYYVEIKNFLDQFTGKKKFNVNTEFLGYVESSSFDPTGSYLSPYITTIGLYNDNNQLLMTAKLGKPIKNLIDWPVNIIVRFDT